MRRGHDVQICTAIESDAPELHEEVQQELKQELQKIEKQLDRKRAASAASSSKAAKQQKLEPGLGKMEVATVHEAVAAFFYAEGIPFVKVACRCCAVTSSLQLLLLPCRVGAGISNR